MPVIKWARYLKTAILKVKSWGVGVGGWGTVRNSALGELSRQSVHVVTPVGPRCHSFRAHTKSFQDLSKPTEWETLRPNIT